ncbi:MAG: UDP-glucose/GDP-mannose dehydrogenase family protein [Alphaproteobacteria bacterium]|nr:UDP-glucose/GDP-mannose dehydrogenase family protein [Alphaproteobacteria bacterium]
MRIAMIGVGYVGLVSGACFSEFGIDVVCVDQDAEKIERLRQAKIPIYEPGLDALVESNVSANRLSFTTDLTAAVREADAVFIAVGTPSRHGDGYADLSYVHAAVEEIARALDGYTVVVMKSTVPVGTAREIQNTLRSLAPEREIDVVSNPEFLREGSALDDFMRPDRVIIGAESEKAREIMRKIYRPLYLIETPIHFTSLEAAELTKYASNGFLAMKVTFMNEIADLCEKVGADVHDVAKGIGLDGRIGAKFLHPGPGYGGSCFPKDTRALVEIAKRAAAPLRLIETVVEVNVARKRQMAQRILAALGPKPSGKTVAVLGLTFKPNTDDVRESPSLDIVPVLEDAGVQVRVFDPEGMEEARKHLKNATYCSNSYEAMEGADALAILTEWNEFRSLDVARMKTCLRHPVVVDLRNVCNPEEMRAAGFDYRAIGRSSTAA